MAGPILIVGCGYVGRRLARRLAGAHRVVGVVRSTRSAALLEQLGIDALTLDLDRPLPANAVPCEPTPAAIFYLAPPAPSGTNDERLQRWLRAVSAPPQVFVYLSTTGVYGHTSGALVDERAPLRPGTDRARRRVSAEDLVRAWCTGHGVRRVVLRAPGIYGPARLGLERLARREPVVRLEDAGVTNRIHVDDLVEACVRGLQNPEACGVYNVTDGNASSSTEFLLKVAALAGLPAPPQVSMETAQLTFGAERLSFINESRQVSNQRMLHQLGVRLRYADLEEGIRASLT